MQVNYALSYHQRIYRHLSFITFSTFSLNNVKNLSIQTIKNKVNEFDLIIVLERLAESLILLKNLLCLDISDVYMRHARKNCGTVAKQDNECNTKLKTNFNENAVIYNETNRPDIRDYNLSLESVEKLEKEFMFNDIKLYNGEIYKLGLIIFFANLS